MIARAVRGVSGAISKEKLVGPLLDLDRSVSLLWRFCVEWSYHEDPRRDHR
jgi:hypothetical protein